MSGRAWIFYGLLVTIAAALAFVTRSSADGGGPDLPSVTNTRGGGLAALKRYLDETGRPTTTLDADFEAARWTTLVVAAPTARQLSKAEVEAIDAQVKRGATFIYLTSDEPSDQPHLHDWLSLHRGDRLKTAPLPSATGPIDPGGATSTVWASVGPFSGLSQLRTSGTRAVSSDDPALLPIAGTDAGAVLLWKRHGAGEIVVAAGADLAENRRIELLDNRRLWDNLAARGPITFDELHQVAAPRPPVSLGIWAFAAQAVFAVIFLTLARGTRLGPPRPLVTKHHRAGIEYAQSFAWLLRGARVEKELAVQLDQRLRRIIHESLGISLSLPPAEFARAVEQRAELEPGTWERFDAQLRAATRAQRLSPEDFARLSKAAALIERSVRRVG